MTYTTTQFVDLVKRRLFLPDQQLAVSDAEIIEYANEEMRMTVQNFMTVLNENYGMQREIVALQDPFSGEDLYPLNIIPIPSRAYCRAIREVKFRDISTGHITNLPLFDMTSYEQYQHRIPYSLPMGVMIVNDGIQLVTRIDTPVKGSIELWYVLEPSVITVPATNSAWHVSVSGMIYDNDTQMTTFTTNNVAAVADMATYGPSSPVNTYRLYDVLQLSTGSVFLKDLLLTRIDNTHYQTLPDAVDAATLKNMSQWQKGGFPVGAPYASDFVLTPAQVTDYIPLMEVVTRWLATLTSCRVCEAIGDATSLSMVKALAEEERNTMKKIMGSRLPGECKRITNSNGIASFFRRMFW